MDPDPKIFQTLDSDPQIFQTLDLDLHEMDADPNLAVGMVLHSNQTLGKAHQLLFVFRISVLVPTFFLAQQVPTLP